MTRLDSAVGRTVRLLWKKYVRAFTEEEFGLMDLDRTLSTPSLETLLRRNSFPLGPPRPTEQPL